LQVLVCPTPRRKKALGAGERGKQANKQIKWQKANGKFQMVCPFAIYLLPFEF
jgi:hypothetical protein